MIENTLLNSRQRFYTLMLVVMFGTAVIVNNVLTFVYMSPFRLVAIVAGVAVNVPLVVLLYKTLAFYFRVRQFLNGDDKRDQGGLVVYSEKWWNLFSVDTIGTCKVGEGGILFVDFMGRERAVQCLIHNQVHLGIQFSPGTTTHVPQIWASVGSIKLTMMPATWNNLYDHISRHYEVVLASDYHEVLLSQGKPYKRMVKIFLYNVLPNIGVLAFALYNRTNLTWTSMSALILGCFMLFISPLVLKKQYKAMQNPKDPKSGKYLKGLEGVRGFDI